MSSIVLQFGAVARIRPIIIITFGTTNVVVHYDITCGIRMVTVTVYYYICCGANDGITFGAGISVGTGIGDQT